MRVVFPKILYVLLVAFLLGSCTTVKEASSGIPVKETTQIQSGSVVTDGSYIGYIEPIESSNLGAKTAGRIVAMNVAKGDRVKAGQVLAILDGQEAKEGLDTASKLLGSTTSVYNNTSALFDAQIATAKTQIEQAKKAIEIANESAAGSVTGLSDTKTTTQEQLKTAAMQSEQAELALGTARTQLDNTKQLFDQKEKDAYTNAQNTLHSADILAKNTLDFVDGVFGISSTNEHSNDAFEMYLGARDSQTKNKTENLWTQENGAYIAWKVKLADISTLDLSVAENKTKLQDFLRESESFFEDLRTLTDAMYNCLDKSISSATFSDATITSLKTQTTTFRTSIENTLISVSGNYIVGIKGSLQNIDSIANERNLQLSLLQKQIELAAKQADVAKQNYAQYQAGSEGKVNEVSTKTNIAAKQVEIAQEQYNQALAALQALEKQKDTQLSQISGNKDLAGIAVSNNTVVAPFDGVISDKFVSVGQVIGSGTPIFAVAKDDTIKVKFLVGEKEVSSVAVGNSVTVTLPDSKEVFSGSISLIQPFADTLSKKVPLEVKLDNITKKFMLGMYVNIRLDTKPATGKMIPYRFIEYSYGNPVVHIQRNGASEPVSATILQCDNENCIID